MPTLFCNIFYNDIQSCINLYKQQCVCVTSQIFVCKIQQNLIDQRQSQQQIIQFLMQSASQHQITEQFVIPDSISQKSVKNTPFKLKNQRSITYHSNYIQYKFPVQILHSHTLIKNKNQFKQLLKKEAGLTNHDEGWYCQQQSSGKKKRLKMYVRCRSCKACIRYKINQDESWILQDYRNDHIHKTQLQKSRRQLSRFQKNYLINIENKDSQETGKKQLIQQKKLLLNNIDFDTLKEWLNFQNYDFLYKYHTNNKSQEGYPEILVVINQMQKINYRRYGECVFYDTSVDGLFKERSFYNHNFEIGIFSGFDNNNRILVFGVCVINNDNFKNYKDAFLFFFQIMGFYKTTCIVTNQQQNISKALNFLKNYHHYYFHHAFDINNYTKQFKHKIKNKIQQKQSISILLKQFQKSIHQFNPNTGWSQLDKFKTLMNHFNLLDQFEQINKKMDHLCFWNMPNQFIGLNLYSSDFLSDLIKQFSKKETTLYNFLKKYERASKQKNLKHQKQKKFESFPFQIMFADQRIRQVKLKIQKKPFYAFICNYNKSLSYQIIKGNQNGKQFFYEIIQVFDKYIYTIRNWICCCGVTEKIGIPCQHLILIMNMKYAKQSYMKFFKTRWLSDVDQISKRQSISQKAIKNIKKDKYDHN